jgi:hypothetical protein
MWQITLLLAVGLLLLLAVGELVLGGEPAYDLSNLEEWLAR